MQDDADLQERGDGREGAGGLLQTWLRPRRSPSCGTRRGETSLCWALQSAALLAVPSPGPYRLADDQVAGEGDASCEDSGRHGNVEAEVKQHVPALPWDEDGAGKEAQLFAACKSPSLQPSSCRH